MSDFKQTIDAYINKVNRIFEKLETREKIFCGGVEIDEHYVSVSERTICIHVLCDDTFQTLVQVVDDNNEVESVTFSVQSLKSFELIDWLYIHLTDVKTELCVKNAKRMLEDTWQNGLFDDEHEEESFSGSKVTKPAELHVGEYKITGTMNEWRQYVDEEDKSYYMYTNYATDCHVSIHGLQIA